MFRAILRGLATAARSALGITFGLFGALLSWPLRMFGADAGDSAIPEPPIMRRPTPVFVGLAPAEMAQSRLRDANMIYSWCGESLLNRTQMPLPTYLSRRTKAWLPGLTYTELIVLSNAGGRAISDHIGGIKRISGLRNVQPLLALRIDFPPAPALPETAAPRVVRVRA
jgi:hypothetical protein